jgi:hypothetical protein
MSGAMEKRAETLQIECSLSWLLSWEQLEMPETGNFSLSIDWPGGARYA